MKLIFNGLLLCHALESCSTFLMYQTMLGYHGSTRLAQSLSYSSEVSLSDSEAIDEHSRGKDKHNEISSSTSESCSRTKCDCFMCGSRHNKCCKRSCEKNCSPKFNYDDHFYDTPLQRTPDLFYDTPFQITPDAIIVPYPVPVVLVVNSSVSTINPTAITMPPVTQTSRATSNSGTHTPSTPPQTPDPNDIIILTTRRGKPFILPSKYTSSTKNPTVSQGFRFLTRRNKRFSVVSLRPNRRQMNNLFHNRRLKIIPKYGLVSIKEVLKRMIKKLKEERKDLLEDKIKLEHLYKT